MLESLGGRLRSYGKLVRKKHRVDAPILVYQMGKVGSMTVYESLKALAPSLQVYHVHLLNHLDEIEASIRESRPDPQDTLREIDKGRRLRRMIFEGEDREWNLVTLVREPVARNVSAFFQNLTEVLPDFYESYQSGSVSTGDLVDAFINQYDHNAPLQWFDSQLNEVFHIDVFSTEFPRDLGYEIYQGPKARLLLLRLEDLNTCIEAAMQQFFGIKRFRIGSSNISTQKAYSSVYREFIDTAVIPQKYLDRMYSSKFAKHFYSTEEIEGFRKQWSQNN